LNKTCPLFCLFRLFLYIFDTLIIKILLKMKKHILITLLLITSLVFTSVSQVNYQWVKAVNSGAPGENTGKAITKDKQGNVYVTGVISNGNDSVDFNTYGNTPVKISNPKGKSCFFAKYTPDGNCTWAKAFGLYSLDPVFPTATGTGIVVDNNNEIYIVGTFKDSIDVDISANEYKLKSKGLYDCFLVKYSSNLSLIWAKQIGGLSFDAGTAIAIDTTSSEIYLTGYFSNYTAKIYGSTGIEDTLANAGQGDIFMAKYGTAGNLIWKKAIGAEGNDIATSIDYSTGSDYIALTGSFQDTVDFNLGQSTPQIDTAVGASDAFVAKFMPDGTCGWEKSFGHGVAGNTVLGTAVKIDENYGKIYLAGHFLGAIELNPADLTNIESAVGQRDVFFSKYNLNDGAFDWGYTFGSVLGTNDTATATGIAIDSDGDNIYLTGGFSGEVNFDPNGNSSLTSAGVVDAFIAKYNESGNYVTATAIGGESSDAIGGIVFSNPENIYTIGSFKDTVDFNPGVGIAKRGNSHGLSGNALFIAKYAQGTGTITGTITYGSSNTLLVSPGNKVQLYTQVPNDGNATMQLVDEVIIDANAGTYTFSDVCAGTYYILAVASMDDYETVVATYYGDTTYWQFATAITVLSDSSYTKNINMVQSAILNGSATLSGYVLEGGGFDRVQGDPIPNRDIVLEEDPGNSIVTHVETDTNGYYEFVNVPAGCYKIYVNIPGLPMDSTHHECPTITDSIVKLNFVADSTSIGIIPSTTGIKQHSKAQQTQLSVYPNPYNGFLFAQLELQKESTVKLELYNIVGKKVLDWGSQTVKAGKTKIQINTKDNNIGSGIYFLKIVVNNKEVLNEKIIQID
jgi:hypothetical protein